MWWIIAGIEIGLVLGLIVVILIVTGVENDWFVE